MSKLFNKVHLACINNFGKLKLEDLKVGMTVRLSQLENIFNVWIYLGEYNIEIEEGKIIYISDTKLDISDDITHVIYHRAR